MNQYIMLIRSLAFVFLLILGTRTYGDEKPPLLAKATKIIECDDKKNAAESVSYYWLPDQTLLVFAYPVGGFLLDPSNGKKTLYTSWTDQDCLQYADVLAAGGKQFGTKNLAIARANIFHAQNPDKIVTLENYKLKLPPHVYIEDFAHSPSDKVAVWSIRTAVFSPLAADIHLKVMPHYRVELVMSRATETSYQNLGELEYLAKLDPDLQRHQLQWTPDGQHISFLYSHTLYQLNPPF